ncbi:MAG: acylneuraminate cytidylyltransferase family protein [Deltaproteobacteria bacterium]|nr:acylneuraminate cytidylyltransferase family protein [Deltaproteobacteria bacterium]
MVTSMWEGNRILGLIPARGGSKGVPRKNLARVGGHSLVSRALNVLAWVPEVDRILVSSEDEEMRAHVNRYGDYAPFARPAELATDSARALPVIRHALEWAEVTDRVTYEAVLLVEPPCPFRLPDHLRGGLRQAFSTDATSVMSLVEVGDAHPIRVKRLGPDGAVMPYCAPEPEGLRRQEQEPAYLRNGAFYVFRRSVVLSGSLWGGRPHGVVMDRDLYGINIDEPVDLVAARWKWTTAAREGRTAQLSPPWRLRAASRSAGR